MPETSHMGARRRSRTMRFFDWTPDDLPERIRVCFKNAVLLSQLDRPRLFVVFLDLRRL